MKKLALIIIPLVLFSCTNKSDKSANNGIPKNFQQTTYLLNTIADKYEIKELKNISDVILNNSGEIKSAIQTNFSFENQDGSKEESLNIYSPIQCWSFLGDSIPILLKYYKQVFTDTVIKDGEYTFQYDKSSRLISFTHGYQPDYPDVIIDFLYDTNGQWTQITKQFRDERSGHSYYEITNREFQYDGKEKEIVNPTYLTVNGENIFNIQRGIVEYYILLSKAGLFNPEGNDGVFDEPNFFFENQDEGTGAGVYTSQLCGWRTNDGKDIIGINGFFRDPSSSFPTISGNPPRFYLFENNSFTNISGIFPDHQVSARAFYDVNYEGEIEEISTYFTLPREGESVRFNLGVPVEFLRENYNEYKEVCDRYSNIKKTSIDFRFDKNSGTFYVDNSQ